MYMYVTYINIRTFIIHTDYKYLHVYTLFAKEANSNVVSYDVNGIDLLTLDSIPIS